MIHMFRRDMRGQIHADIELVPAKVPILKLVGIPTMIKVDISSNAKHGIVNTHLLFCYSQVITLSLSS